MKLDTKKRYDLTDLTSEELEVIGLGLEEMKESKLALKAAGDHGRAVGSIVREILETIDEELTE